MKVLLKTAPTIEPITLLELKGHLRVDSETLAGNLITYQSILPGSHGISAGGLYSVCDSWSHSRYCFLEAW